MDFNLLHPREIIVMLMARVYRYGMTTTSGGNLSIREENGDIWITPAAIDKGTLRSEDIICVKADGTIVGRHRPSSEFPFHKAIYEMRPDLRGIVHAHPCALVAFSLVRQTPPTHILPQAREVCGHVGYAPYALPGSVELGRNLATAFRDGLDCIIMENHGVACGGTTLLQAFHRFETLDFCARMVIKATMLGKHQSLTDEQIALMNHSKNLLPEFEVESRTNAEKEFRRTICDLAHRAYDQQLMTSTEGVISVRLSASEFLITPSRRDRRLLEVADLVLIKAGSRERGKVPSRSVKLHERIYLDHPEVNAIVSAQAPCATAFSVSHHPFDTRSIPESYLLLRDVPKIPYGPQFTDEAVISETLSSHTPVILLENDAVLTTGRHLLEAYDRLEVAEFSARSLIYANSLGGLKAIGADSIRELEQHFLGM
jgi:L-fuculose-phosphate aldolase